MMMMMMVMMTIMMIIMMMIVSVEQRPGWGEHVKTITNHPMFDDYHPSMVILGMVYVCFNHILSL